MLCKNRKRLLISLCVLSALAVLTAVAYPFAVDDRLEVSYYTVRNAKIPEAFEGYKIAHASDLHCCQVPELTRRISQEQPDIIVLTGDIIDEVAWDTGASYKFINEIAVIAPVYEITGNHEVWYDKANPGVYQAYLEKKGVVNADGQSIPLEKDGEKIMLTGITDTNWLYDDTCDDFLRQTIEQTVPPLDASKYNILLYHRSCQYNVLLELETDLILSGHLHGGAVRIPLLGGLVSPEQVLFPPYAGGHYLLENDDHDHADFIVSRGLGTQSRFPRVFNRPELVIITLTPTMNNSK